MVVRLIGDTSQFTLVIGEVKRGMTKKCSRNESLQHSKKKLHNMVETAHPFFLSKKSTLPLFLQYKIPINTTKKTRHKKGCDGVTSRTFRLKKKITQVSSLKDR